MTIDAVFKGLCPNCGKDISVDRLGMGLPCINCFPVVDENFLKKLNKNSELGKYYNMLKKVEKWEKHFEKYMNSKPWSLQITWAKRVLLKRSFALLAPTGVGKSSFGISMATFLQKSYIILPTRLLVNQVYNRILQFGVNKEDVIAFGLEKCIKEKEYNKERLKNGNFKIVISTSNFLYKNYKLFPRNIKYIFIDDVDSFLKNAKNIDKVLYLLGFNDNDIEEAFNLIKLKTKKNKSDKDWELINEFQNKIEKIKSKVKGVLVVSSATSNPKSNRIKLFRELLNFEVGKPVFYLRNIVDTYTNECSIKSLTKFIKKFGNGGLIFVSSDYGKEKVNEIVLHLNRLNLKAISYEELDDMSLNDFRQGKISVIVGISSYRNPLARGFDEPAATKYVIFFGVPKITISLNFESNLSHLLWALVSIRGFIIKNFNEYSKDIENWIKLLKKYQFITEDFLQRKLELKNRIENLKSQIFSFLNSKKIIDLLNKSNEIILKKDDKGYSLAVSDVTGYLQASGRSSRMYPGGITKGLSLVLVDDNKAFNHLLKKVRWFSEDINFVPIDKINIENVIKEIKEDREKVKKISSNIMTVESKDFLKPVLIVVESPNKARTIANFFGKPIRRRISNHEVLENSTENRYFLITASLGHLFDLVKNEGYHGIKLNDKNIIPVYEVIDGKEEIVKSIKQISLETAEILIATDPDTEGEKISWDLNNLLKPLVKNIKRMEFHEVTKKAIMHAIKEPREFNLNLVKAQIVRRISDRWIGFEASQILQRFFGKNWLSAGRVQTPVLGWIIDRENESKKKVYKILITLSKDNKKLIIEFNFENKNEAKNFFNELEEVEIIVKKEKNVEKDPLPPYRTDTMLKDASDKYKFSLYKTMKLAQDLFESGYITYHRTDSVRVSDVGIKLAKEFIEEEFGENYFYSRTWGGGGAHECIRPTKLILSEDIKSMILSGQIEGISNDHILLYDMIVKRFFASQMRSVIVTEIDVEIKALSKKKELTLLTKVVKDGWDKILPIEVKPIFKGIVNVKKSKSFKVQPKKYLFTHGELVKEMKIKGIGRPSTYAITIEKLIERGYVKEKNNFLIPTELGKKVYSYLMQREDIAKFLSENFTRELEKNMDQVEEGKEDYKKVLLNLKRKISNFKQYSL